MTIKADLGSDVEKTIADLIAKGSYSSESDVLTEGVRLVEARERKRAELEALIQEGLDDVAAGRTIPAEDVFAELKARFPKAKAG